MKNLALARAAVEDLTKKIGQELAKCQGVSGADNEITHLKIAYQPELSESQYRRYDYMDEDELVLFLEESCQHCLNAHRLIQERKRARKRYGSAKSVVTKIGREACGE